MAIQKAVDCGANAVVIECMAIRPELQNFCEKRLIRSHIGIITNVRADHEDVMGCGIHNVAASLSHTIPQQGCLVTTSEVQGLLESLNIQAHMVIVSGEELEERYQEEFPYEVIPENLAIALKVCEMSGVAAETALTGMRAGLVIGG